jgi:phosphoglucosamine mutase
MKLVIDCANGASYQVAPRVFEELGAEVVAIGNAPDGFNINQEYGSTSPGNLITQVIERQADIGIAFDGDGDRVIMIDRHGEIVDGDELVFIMAQYRAKNHADTAIVGTQMSNLGLELAIRGMGVDFRRSAVGDRHVMEMLKQGGWKLGGESSGHIISLDHTTTGDGIVTALQVLTALVVSDLPLHEAKQGMSKYPQCLINIKLPEDLPADKRAALVKSPEVEQAMHAAQEELQENGRILLRASGTEPLFRVMVEGRDDTQVTRLANRLAEVVAQASQ